MAAARANNSLALGCITRNYMTTYDSYQCAVETGKPSDISRQAAAPHIKPEPGHMWSVCGLMWPVCSHMRTFIQDGNTLIICKLMHVIKNKCYSFNFDVPS